MIVVLVIEWSRMRYDACCATLSDSCWVSLEKCGEVNWNPTYIWKNGTCLSTNEECGVRAHSVMIDAYGIHPISPCRQLVLLISGGTFIREQKSEIRKDSGLQLLRMAMHKCRTKCQVSLTVVARLRGAHHIFDLLGDGDGH